MTPKRIRKYNYPDKQFTGSQRLVLLYRYAANRQPFSATQFAEENHIKYHLVYHYLKLLKKMGFPIVNTTYGEWQWITDEPTRIVLNYQNQKLTRAQNLVKLYIELQNGNLISPTRYAKSVGVSRQTIYHQLDLLSQLGIPVINLKDGWTLLDDKGLEFEY